MSSPAISHAMAVALHGARQPWRRVVQGWVIAALVVGVFIWFCIDLELTPSAFGRGLENLRRFLGAMYPPSDGGDPLRIVRALAETFAMAVAGTAIAAFFAAPLGVLAAKTVVSTASVHFILRRVLDLFRGIPALVWALILVSALGLGPFPGVLALAFADIPRLAKLHAEAIENIDERPREALKAAGVAGLLAVRYAVAPQLAPVWLSQILYYLEQNFRSAAVLGIVGAGGIGFELEERIRIFAFDEVAYIIILYCLCVALLDHVSGQLRAKLVEGG